MHRNAAYAEIVTGVYVVTEEELTTLRLTHDFELVPQEPGWLSEDAHRMFDDLQSRIDQAMAIPSYMLGNHLEVAHHRRSALEATEVLRIAQRRLVQIGMEFPPPLIMAKPKRVDRT